MTRKRKAYKPRPMMIPMMPSTHDSLAMELHLQVEGFIANPCKDGFRRLYRIVIAMLYATHKVGMAGLPWEYAAMEAINQIIERNERTGAIGLSGDEMQALRNVAGEIDSLVPSIPFNIMRESILQAGAEIVMM